jgi:predicted nucleotidyltransferase
LEGRNDRIIEAIIKKAENVCPGAIALIGIAGSFHSGDIYEKSDLDLCIVINDDSAWKVASCFILDDVAFDIYIALLGANLRKCQNIIIRILQNYLS